jgi:hypothetical protein
LLLLGCSSFTPYDGRNGDVSSARGATKFTGCADVK